MLERLHFLIKQQVAFMKTTDTYDIFDPETGVQVGVAREVIPSWAQILRRFGVKSLMPTRLEVSEHPEGALVFVIKKPVGIFRKTVEVYDAQGVKLGYFKSKLLSLGGGFWVYDLDGKPFAEVRGNWLGWDFKFVTPEGMELGQVTKRWAGLLKTLLAADNYVVSVADQLAEQPIAKMLLLAAALAFDIVYKEKGGGQH